MKIRSKEVIHLMKQREEDHAQGNSTKLDLFTHTHRF